MAFFKEDEIDEIMSKQQEDNFGDLLKLKRTSLSENTRVNIMRFAPAPKLEVKQPPKKRQRMRRRNIDS